MRYYFRILGYGKQWYGNLAAAIGFLVLFNLFSAASLALFIPFLEILFADTPPPASIPAAGSEALAQVNSLKEQGYQLLFQAIHTYGKVTALWYFCGAVAAIIFLKNFFKYLSAFTMAPLEHGIVKNIRTHFFQHLTRLSLGYYTRQRRGHIVNASISDMQNVQDAVVGTLLPLISDPLTMITLLAVMFNLSWKLTLFTLIVLPITAGVISRIASSLKRKVVRGQGYLDGLLTVVDEFLGGIRIVKAFTAEGYVVGKYQRLNEQYNHVMIRFRRQVDLASPLTEFLSILVILGIILYGGLLILSGEGDLRASEFITFIVLFSQFIAPMKALSQAVARVQKAQVSFGRIEAITLEPVQATESKTGKVVTGFEQSIELRHLSFRYEEDKRVLHDINLTIQSGETLALVGPSGGGKSTLLDLLCRLYDPEEGQILLDGTDLKDINTTSLRQLMGVVTQEGILFNDTVRNNIAYGNPDFTDAEIEKAAQIANADAFIRQLPDSYNTIIGERGLTLSGGQRQRLSIARAVLRNPPILILDEATSALDSESERLVQSALDSLMQNKTSIVVAHRLSTIVNADKIAVINQGRVEDIGTHKELLARGGKYAELYILQFQPQPTE